MSTAKDRNYRKQLTDGTLTEKLIERHVGERSFRLGQNYYGSGMVFDCRRQGELLKARCRGRSADHYVLSARVHSGRIKEAECSCPVGAGGGCKHVAALMLTWLHAPEEFRETESLGKRLSACSKSKLIALIEQMLENEPDLDSWLELALPSAEPSDTVLKPEAYRHQTVAAFASAGYGWEADRQLTASLEALRRIGDQFRKQKSLESAAAVYCGVLDGFISEYETFHDETGNVLRVASDCIKSLGECLSRFAEGSETRKSAVRALFDVLRFDINFGGIGLSDGVPDSLQKQATPAERAAVASWIRAELPGGKDFTSNWRREAWGGLLLDLEGEPADDDSYLRHCREFGLTGDLVERLLERGRLEEALQEVKASSDYDVMGHADRLIAHKHVDLAHSVVRDRFSDKNGRNNWQLRDWLKRFYKSRKQWTSLLEVCVDEFRREPRLAVYQEIRNYARKLKSWDSLRPKLMSSVSKDSAELIRIHVDEGEVAHAIERLESRPPKRGFMPGWERVDLEVAKAAESSHPQAALKIYQAVAEEMIAVRGRENYQSACAHLKKVKRLFKTVGRNDDWQAYLANLRDQNRSLRALQEELTRAGL